MIAMETGLEDVGQSAAAVRSGSRLAPTATRRR